MTDAFSFDRRGALASIAALIGASALPADALAAPKKGAKKFLSPAQFAVLSSVADTILPASDSPGAITAKVPARIDSLLANWASAKTRTEIAGALSRVDAEAKAKTKKGFAALPPAQRDAVLRAYDVAALKKAPPPPDAPPTNFFVQPNYVVDPGYLKLKELVVDLYYFSPEANGKELTYEHVPGKFEPSIKLTPASRPYLGTGPF
ncbi:MAG: gluconate 2-dehydrogenase subunit 3 family protein [Novosphingobium sp.]